MNNIKDLKEFNAFCSIKVERQLNTGIITHATQLINGLKHIKHYDLYVYASNQRPDVRDMILQIMLHTHEDFMIEHHPELIMKYYSLSSVGRHNSLIGAATSLPIRVYQDMEDKIK